MNCYLFGAMLLFATNCFCTQTPRQVRFENQDTEVNNSTYTVTQLEELMAEFNSDQIQPSTLQQIIDLTQQWEEGEEENTEESSAVLLDQAIGWVSTFAIAYKILLEEKAEIVSEVHERTRNIQSICEEDTTDYDA